MYWYHSKLVATHPYQSPWDTWPITQRPVYYYVSPTGDAKIYALGNPILFWFALPALAFALWQGLKRWRLSYADDTGDISVAGRWNWLEFGLVFVVVGYLAFLLPWALAPRIMFFYHFLPSVPFMLLALGYTVWRLWQVPWGKAIAVALPVAAVVTFLYFYPHWAAVPVPTWLEESYYWFPSWR
jgi:dolichyl-phosphate-mannose--protein O-mannosyl transferase